MYKLVGLITILAAVGSAINLAEEQEIEQEDVVQRVMDLLNNMETENDKNLKVKDDEINADSVGLDDPADAPLDPWLGNSDSVEFNSDPNDDIMKRFYIKVTRQFCPPNVECMKFRGRRKWQRCECPRRQKCRPQTRTAYKCS